MGSLFIYRLLKEYKKRFGFKNIFFRNVKYNKWILFYLFASLCFPVIIFLLFYFQEINWMVLSIILYILVLYFGGEQHKRKMNNSIPENTITYDVVPFRNMLHESFSITTDEQLLRLDEIIKREIASVEYNRKFPLSDVIRQLFIALLVTGLLSYAFFEVRDGNIQKAAPLLTIYILIIGLVFFVGGVLKQIREFGPNTHLNDISFLIHLSLLDRSIKQNKDVFQGGSDVVHLSPRKEKHK
jgi:hypothetical protein